MSPVHLRIYANHLSMKRLTLRDVSSAIVEMKDIYATNLNYTEIFLL